MKIFRNCFVLISLIAISFLAAAFGLGSGKILQVRLDSTPGPGGAIISPSIVILSVPSSGPAPACATFSPNQAFAFDMSNIQGRAYYAMFLSAQATGHTVTISGTGTCNTNSNVENLQWAVKSNSL